MTSFEAFSFGSSLANVPVFGYTGFLKKILNITELENSTSPLIIKSVYGCRASNNYDVSGENTFFSHRLYANNFCDAGQVPILRYFEACVI